MSVPSSTLQIGHWFFLGNRELKSLKAHLKHFAPNCRYRANNYYLFYAFLINS
ncbi:hypothetical protein LINPERPRIM_LOCUS29063 [Linum perenne]